MTPSLTLARFLTLFLVRRVLRRGALQVPLVRWTLLVVIVMAVVALFAFGVVTLRQLIVDPEMLRPLLRVAGAAVPLWVVALFTLVRILFLKSGDLVELTYCLPITNRARMLGFMLFEALLVGGGLVLILGALICGSLSIGGPGVLDDIATCLLMPAVVAYLLASAYYLALERMLMRLRLARLRSFLVPIVLAATLVALYAWVSSQSEAVLFASVGQGTHFALPLVFADIAEAQGLLVATLCWLAAVVLAAAIVLVVNPRSFEPTRRFAAAPRLLGGSEFGAYFDAHLRAIETMTVYGLALAGSYALLLLDIALPPFLLLAVTVQSVYAYVSTEPLRACGPRRHDPLVRYLLLLGPQLVAFLLCAVPTGVMSAVTGIDIVSILAVVGFGVVNIVVLTLAGITFPPEKGNPFSVVVGVVTTGLATGALLLGTNLLGLPAWASITALIVIGVGAAALSLVGMQRIERTERHEVVVQSARKRGRRGRDPRRSGGDDVRVAHVLGRVD